MVPVPRVHDVELMLATPGGRMPSAGWLFEIKYDGWRLLIQKQGAALTFLTRQRKEATDWFPTLTAQVGRLPGSFVVDAEVCALDVHGRPDFEQMRRARQSSRTDLRLGLFAFDLISIDRKDCRTLPLIRRKQQLERLVLRGNQPSISYVSHIETAGQAFYDEVVRFGLEGIIAKRADSPYVGGRSKDWLKFKANVHDGWKRRKPAR